jgi:hypothetical protein
MRRFEMPELEHLRNFAAATRHSGFNIPFFRLDGNNGEYRRKNYNGTMNGQKLGCDPVDAITGYQKFENKVPIYHVGRAADGYQPPPRAQLGDLDEKSWPEGKDPWVQIDLLPFWDLDSREVLLFSAANQGSRDAVANLIETYVNNIEAHPEDSHKVPLVELATNSYRNRHGKEIYVPVFEVINWVERPNAVRRILPPPVKMLQLTAAPTVAPAAPPSGTIPVKSDSRAKSKPKKPVNFDVDDETF